MEQITDYGIKNKNPYLIEIMRNSTVKSILESSDPQFNELEIVFFQIYLNIWLDTAIGAQLDLLGEHLDVIRNGRVDNAYRIILKAKVQINISSGEPERLILAVQSLFDIMDVTYYPVYPAKALIYSATEELELIVTGSLATESENNLVTTGGDNLIVKFGDPQTSKSLLQVVPSGVGLLFGSDLIVDTGEYIITDTGDGIIVSSPITE